MAMIVAKANTSADLVSKLSHKTIAKLTIELVRIEKNCPVHIIANTFFQLFINNASIRIKSELTNLK